MAYSLAHPDPRWRWHYDADDRGAPAYRIPGAPPAARGSISIWMPDASAEEFEEIRRRLIRRFNPAFEVPASPSTDDIGQRSGGHANDYRYR